MLLCEMEGASPPPRSRSNSGEKGRRGHSEYTRFAFGVYTGPITKWRGTSRFIVDFSRFGRWPRAETHQEKRWGGTKGARSSKRRKGFLLFREKVR